MHDNAHAKAFLFFLFILSWNKQIRGTKECVLTDTKEILECVQGRRKEAIVIRRVLYKSLILNNEKSIVYGAEKQFWKILAQNQRRV